MLGLLKGDIKDTVKQVHEKHPEAIVIVVQGCNCMNNMGAGLAKTIAQEWPAAVRADKSTKKGDINKLGNYTLASINQKLVIVNLYSQYKYGGGVNIDYNALDTGLKRLVEEINRQLIEVIFLVPEYIGCGLAGGDINIVRPILTSTLDGTNYYLFDK